MKKKGIILLIFLIVNAVLTGQAPPWDWVTSLRTNQMEVVTNVVADPVTGEVYLAGTWRGSLDDFIPGGGTESTDFSSTYGGDDGLVAKYSPDGDLLWAFKIGGNDPDRINAIHLDMDGNIYITGSVSPGFIHFSGTGSFTPDSTYINPGNKDFFLAKYDPHGRLLWIRHSDGESWIEGRGITSNSEGVFAIGNYMDVAFFGSMMLHPAHGNEDVFVVKYTPDGNELWQISGGSDLHDAGEDITCDETHLFITGEFEGDMLSLSNAAGDIMTGIMNTASGVLEVFLASYTSDGDHLWTSTIDSPEDDFCLGLTMDNDSLYLVGSTGASALFHSYAGNPVMHMNGQDAFICSMSRLDGSTGWVVTLTDESGGDEVARDISMDSEGNLYVTGYFQTTIKTPVGSYNTKGDEDIFLVSLTDGGQINWIKTAGSTQPDFGNGVSATAPGSVYLAGNYSELTAFDSIVVPDDGVENMFLARLHLSCLNAVGGVLNTTEPVVCETSMVSLMLKNYMGIIEWQTSSPGLNSWSTLTTNLSDSIAFSPAVTADYRAYLRSGSCAPDSSNIITVQVNPTPPANISGGGDVCGLVFDLQAFPGMNSGLWSLASGPGAATFSPSPESAIVTVSVTDYGSYEFTWTETNGLCTRDSSVAVRFFLQPVIALIPGSAACGLQFGLDVNTDIEATGSWSLLNGPGNAIFLPDENTPNAEVHVDTYGVYSFRWIALNGVCSNSAVTDVEFLTVPEVDAGEDQLVCQGDPAQLKAIGEGSFQWNHPNQLSDANIPDPIAMVDATSIFLVKVTNDDGCENTDTLTLFVLSPPVAEAGPDQHHIGLYETLLEGKLGRNEKGTWTVVSGGGIFEDPHNPVSRVTHLEIGENILAWQITNEVCPEEVDQVKIQVEDFVIPTVITPNGDGKNDRFQVEGILKFKKSELIILNQWGEVVYRASPYVNAWKGEDKIGRGLPEGNYFRVLRITEKDIRKGYVLIIR